MASVNQCNFIGNVGNDPEVKYLDGDKVVAKFSIAVTESYNDKNGQRVDHTEWIRIEMWGGLAKVAEKYLKKGNPVYVSGRIRTDKWTDKDGLEKSGFTIRVATMTLLGGGQSSGGSGNGQQAATRQPNGNTQTSSPPTSTFTGDDDDLPF